MSLRSLDDRLVPRAASTLRRQVARLDRVRDRTTDRARVLHPRSLDERLLEHGPLRALVRWPAASLLVVALVLVAGVGAAVDREQRAVELGLPQTGSPTGQPDVPRGALLGPSVGDSTRGYEELARRTLVEAVQKAPERPRVALVSLVDYRTPAQADALLAGFTVHRVYLRAKAAGPKASQLPVEVKGDLLTALREAYAESARSRKASQGVYTSYADALKPDATKDKAFRKLYLDYAKSSGIEAQEYAKGCACVFAAVVSAPAAQLVSLQARPGVRAVQLAAQGLSVLQVQVQALLPETRGVVPRPSAVGPS